MAFALVHFTVGFVIVLAVVSVVPVTRYRLTAAFAGGIWAVGPDIHHLLSGPLSNQIYSLHDSPISDVFFFPLHARSTGIQSNQRRSDVRLVRRSWDCASRVRLAIRHCSRSDTDVQAPGHNRRVSRVRAVITRLPRRTHRQARGCQGRNRSSKTGSRLRSA